MNYTVEKYTYPDAYKPVFHTQKRKGALAKATILARRSKADAIVIRTDSGLYEKVIVLKRFLIKNPGGGHWLQFSNDYGKAGKDAELSKDLTDWFLWKDGDTTIMAPADMPAGQKVIVHPGRE